MTAVSRTEASRLEKIMLAMPQVKIKVIEHWSKGVYAREIHIPAGTALTGRIHKFANLNILSKGAMLVIADGAAVQIHAPFTVVSPPGTKRIAYAQTDCVWTTIHGTDETDTDLIENEFTAGSEQEYLAFADALKLQGA